MSSLLLQKPSQKSKSRESLKVLEWRMELWTSGEILDLLHEGATIQKDLRPSNTPSIVATISKNSRYSKGKCHQCNEAIYW